MDKKRQEVSTEEELSVLKQCELLELSRSSYYYQPKTKEVDYSLKEALFDIHEECPFWGYRKVLIELKKRGFDLGKKMVMSLKKKLGLKTIYPQSKTSIPNKAHKKYPYLLRDVEITHSNHVWSADFTGRLESEGIAISMDGKGRCLDNIFIERWFRSLKYEDIYLKDYRHMLELKVGIKRYVQFYNERRYHQSLEYQTPDQVFYADLMRQSDQGVKVA